MNNNLILIQPTGDDLDSPERIARQKINGPQRGDIWLASQPDSDVTDDYNEYVLILHVYDDDSVIACPLSNDERAYVPGTILIEETPLNTPMVAYPKFAARIQTRLLYKPLKNLPELITSQIAHACVNPQTPQVDLIENWWVRKTIDLMRENMLVWSVFQLIKMS
ncbi:hypothetical protein [Bifidobacterium sp. SO1]|uniref:hypothetical protein n=1 Tax=Bifidobacterium sp. SO1 TaxID=2809029 RepID=UPI001BDC2B38|nr:hypothetical protein [Bifidobacterium sp. SO1]MBT1162568.1 hypothetical protein [Bifidobacterium sp. SO1]